MATMTIRSTLMMILIPVGIQAQIGSRLVGYAFRSMNAIQLMVLSDSLQYTYTGERGGDLTTELKFDRSYQWSFDQFNVFALHSGHSRAYDSNDLVLTDSSLTLNVAPPVVTDYFRWTYDGQGRPATQVQFVGSDSTSFSSYSYTPSGKPAVNFRSQLSGGIWYDTTEDYTYNAMDSLTDKVVTSDFLSYAFHWVFSPEGWLVHYEELTPSGDLYTDRYYHTNGKLMAEHTTGSEFGPQNDSTFYGWNATFDTVLVYGYNLFFSATDPNYLFRYAYDVAGDQVEYVSYDLVGLDATPNYRQATTRTDDGQVLVDSSFTWDGTVFVHQTNENYAYDAEGHQLERIVSQYSGSDLVPIFGQFWTYNAAGQLTSAGNADMLNGTWVTSALSQWYYEDIALAVDNRAPSVSISAYPVPSTGEVTVTWGQGSAKLRNVRVYDAQGRLVLSRSDLPSTSTTLDLRGIAPGAYIVEVDDGAQVERTAIVLK